jgi:hypothetical protein
VKGDLNDAANPPAAMFCGAAGKALNPAGQPFNNLKYLFTKTERI